MNSSWEPDPVSMARIEEELYLERQQRARIRALEQRIKELEEKIEKLKEGE